MFRATLPAALTVLLLGLTAAFLAPRAEARCEICDAYTLDIPPPKSGGGGGSGGGGSGSEGSSPEPAPAPIPAPAPAPAPEPVAPAPAETVPSPADDAAAERRREQRAERRKRRRQRLRRERRERRENRRVSIADPAASSTPLSYDEGSDSSAAMGALTDPATAGLLVALLGGGGIIAFGRRSRED